MYQFGQALSDFMADADMTQIQVGRALNASNSLVCKVANGDRKPTKEFMKAAAGAFDYPPIQFATIYDITGGAYPVWMNNVNLEPGAVALKAIEEMEEAIMAIKAAPLHKMPGTLTAEDDVKIDRMLEEAREAAHALLTLKGVGCMVYKRSWIKNWIGHNLQLIAKRYFLK